MPKSSNTDLLSLQPEDLIEALEKHFRERNQPIYRIKQVIGWIYEGLAASIDEMTDLHLAERETLKSSFALTQLEEARVQVSQDGTVKHLWGLWDGEFIESVLIPTKKRLTLCISSQAGCAMGCTFCATGWGGFRRQLTTGEIVSQYSASKRWAEKHLETSISNIVYMGMGEPFLNYDNVIKSANIINNKKGFNISYNKITISTVGIIPKIEKFIADGQPYKLAISLNATDDETRTKIIPINKKWNIDMIIKELEKYPSDKKNMIMLEYVLLKGINDTIRDAEILSSYANKLRCKVNVIPFNDIGNKFSRPDEQTINRFIDVLHQNQKYYQTLVRWSKGTDIDAACGQLSSKHND